MPVRLPGAHLCTVSFFSAVISEKFASSFVASRGAKRNVAVKIAAGKVTRIKEMPWRDRKEKREEDAESIRGNVLSINSRKQIVAAGYGQLVGRNISRYPGRIHGR